MAVPRGETQTRTEDGMGTYFVDGQYITFDVWTTVIEHFPVPRGQAVAAVRLLGVSYTGSFGCDRVVASDARCRKSYALLHTLPDTDGLKLGSVICVGVSSQTLVISFPRATDRLSVDGKRFVLLLSYNGTYLSDVRVPCCDSNVRCLKRGLGRPPGVEPQL